MAFYILAFFLSSLLFAFGGRPEVKCPVPISPPDGQVFIMKSGTAVKYICNPGFEHQGTQIAFCKNGEWQPEAPSCVASGTGADEIEEPMPPTPRPLFKWDDENNATRNENDTMQGDDSRVIYVRRWPYHRGWDYHRAPLHEVATAEEITQAKEDNLRYYYWNAHYPRSPLVDYRALGLSESQWAWINNLHPETRDKYLKDLHKMGVIDANYLNHVNDYRFVNPYYVRQPVAVVAENHVSTLDYSCHRTERDGRVVTIRAPKLPNAYLYKYDRRQNANYPHNDYLAAEYRCKVGYTLLNPTVNELYCSRSSWVGHRPTCVPRI